MLAGLAIGRPLRADAARPFDLVWSAPPSCPTSAEVEHEIERLIGGARHPHTAVRARGEVTRHGDAYRVVIRIQDGERVSERSFDGATGRAIAKAGSLIIALAIEPNAGALAEAPPPAAPETPAPPPPPIAPASATRAALGGVVMAGPAAEFRSLPSVGLGFEVAGGLRLPHFSTELRTSATLPQPADVPSSVAPAAGGRFFLITAGLRLCARIVRGGPELFACASGFFDWVHARGYGITAPSAANALTFAAALGPRVEFPLADALRGGFTGEATYAFGEASFRLDNVGNVHRTPRWGGAARLYVALSF